MDLISDRGRRVTIEELNTSRLLAHARKQAVQRKLDDMLIVDVDAHHYESENYREFLPYMENDVLKQLAMQGIAKGSRGALENMAFLREGLTHPAKNAAVAQLAPIAAELGGSVAQLALAWAARNPRVSSVITGASKLSQLQANLGALALLDKLTPEVMARIDAATAGLAE